MYNVTVQQVVHPYTSTNGAIVVKAKQMTIICVPLPPLPLSRLFKVV